ncbi:SAM-dependent methyltransferase [Nonomuraea sp. SBT364]|uniref:SAM-dependent methyltransferase n=1 Tax=Nonomuraea sp. SBT364 TaxID=1580530 RepID=UPI000A862D7C|nr:SAM-dependent methyltransferase [Nonomuraea sp. SBT364]
MSDTGGWEPHVPHVARMYDYFLGGRDNYAVDREAAAHVLDLVPGIREDARANRAFLGRAVRALSDQGIGQFLDIGSGLPTCRSVHQVLPGRTTVYVDSDSQVVSHARTLLDDVPEALAVCGDLRKPADILGNPAVGEHLDLDRPVAVLLLAIAHYVADDPQPLIAELMAPLAPGSHLVLSHVTDGTTDPRPLFDGLDLLPPGVVTVPEWRPEDLVRPPTPHFLCGVARKP